MVMVMVWLICLLMNLLMMVVVINSCWIYLFVDRFLVVWLFEEDDCLECFFIGMYFVCVYVLQFGGLFCNVKCFCY